ncbi:MAG TPA: translocation and assembly module protein TamB, partial [Paracoccaceae bacterium]|nr:translocation and assembly module protein TamB [Paracoccaceae bacterium]
APSLGLRIVGAGPLDAFAADLLLATDDAPRLTGRVTLGTKAQLDTAPTRVFNAAVSGDITPLLFPAYQGFFGPDVRLALRGEAAPDGAIRIDDLTMTSAAMRLRGQLHLSPDHWPERAQLAGHIGAPDGQPVLLPLSGPQTSIQSMDIALAYDRAQGDGWTVSLTLERFFRQALSLRHARLSGSGALSAGDGGPVGQLDGQISLSLAGIAPRDPALARALGTDLSGGATIAWSEGAAFQLPSFALAGSDYGLTGTGTVQGLQKALQLKAAGKLALNAADLTRFDGLAGVPLTGAAHLAIEGAGEPLGGGFDIAITGKTQDLGIGQPRLDPLLTGAGDLVLRARRDATG